MAPDPASVVFVGYWSGPLPALSELHFRSFVAHHPKSRYELWLDSADANSGAVQPQLAWIKSHPRITLRQFSLDELIQRHVTDGRPLGAFDRLRTLRRLAHGAQRRMAVLRGAVGMPGHPLAALERPHSSPLFVGFAEPTYRAELARCLVPLEHHAGACVHVDLDLCFAADLTLKFGDKAFAYRWERRGFACPSVLYLPDRSWSEALVRRGRALESFLPWTLFADQCCTELGIAVQPARLFDASWDPTSLLYGDLARFFGPRDNLALDLHALAGERHLALRWHGHWQAKPAPTSIYAGLLRACERVTA